MWCPLSTADSIGRSNVPALRLVIPLVGFYPANNGVVHDQEPLALKLEQPLKLQRQVRVATGTIVLPVAYRGSRYHLLAGLVEAGLVLAGVYGSCGLARVLVKAPWSRKSIAR